MPLSHAFGFGTNTLKVAAANFDGSNDYMLRGADLTGNANGKLGIISCWARTKQASATFFWYIGDTTSDSGKVILNNGEFKVEMRDGVGGTILLSIKSTGTDYNDGLAHHFMASWDLGATTAHLYVDGIEDKTETTNTDGTIDYTRADHVICAEQSGPFGAKFNGDLGQLYINTAEYLDLSSAVNRLKFYNGGPVDLGIDGALPTGTAPIVFLTADIATPDNFANNQGGGGNLSVTGALANGVQMP